MDGVQFAVYGLKILISLFCFGASFYQSFVLFDNFKSKDTLRKNTEVTYPDNYTTPMIIVCSDPGNQKPEDPLIELNNEADLSGLIPPVRVFRTMYKGVCNIIDSFTIPSTIPDVSPFIYFNSSKTLLFYSLFPGQKMFLSVYHPTESLEAKTINGANFHKLSLIPKVTALLPNNRNCQAAGQTFVSVRKAHNEYDTCLAREMLKKAKELNITYHPILDNFKEFDDIPRTEFDESLEFNFSSSLTTGFTICKAPCVTVTYRMALDKFSMTPEKMVYVAGGPDRGVCWVQFSRTVQFEVEDYIVKSVDLLSGFGGAMGLWLGWSVLSLGNSIVKAFRTFTSVKLFK